MRISGWSSDVCSSDLSIQSRVHDAVLAILRAPSFESMIQTVTGDLAIQLDVDAVTIGVEAGDVPIPKAYAAGIRALPEGAVDGMLGRGRDVLLAGNVNRSEERRVGKACVSTVRSRWSPYASKKINT